MLRKERTSFMTFNVAVLNLLNYWPQKSDLINPKWRFLRDISLIVSLMPCALTILADFLMNLYEGVQDLTAITENLIALNCIIGMIYMVVCFTKKRNLIESLVFRLNDFTEFVSYEEIVKIDKKANLYSKIFLMYGILGNIVYMLMPQLNVKQCRNKKDALLEEDVVPCGMVTRARFPFSYSQSPFFEMVFLHQIYTCTMVTVVILVLTMLLCGFLMHIVYQLSQVRLGFKNLGRIVSLDDLKKLHYFIGYHIEIIRYSDDTNNAFSSMMLLHLTLTSVVISVLCFEVIMVDNFTDSVRFTFHLLGWLVLLLLICFYAQQLIDESTKIAREIYDGQWSESSVHARKDMLMILVRAQRPLTLSAANLGAMSLPTFLRVMSSAYSFFTLLLKLKS